MATEARFATMGSRGHVVVHGRDSGLVDFAIDRLDELEARWSRFVATSELMRLNQADGHWMPVSYDTYRLCKALRSAYQVTNARFNPTVIDAEEALGYGVTFESIAPPAALPPKRPLKPFNLQFDGRAQAVRLAPGVRIDAGGLGKGLAADIVAREVLDRGANAALINVGGDLRVVGRPPRDRDWVIEIEDPVSEGVVAYARLTEGGVATSTTQRRRWTIGSTTVHHLIEPTTSRPAETARVQVTVAAPTAAWAEVWAKVALLDGALPRAAVARAFFVDGTHCHATGRAEVADFIARIAA